jgi:uridine kinase
VKPVYLIAGSPGSGKSWVCEQLTKAYKYIPHDDFIGKEKEYHEALRISAKTGDVPVLTETPFSVSTIKDMLEKRGIPCVPLFIVEPVDVISKRYQQRKGEEIPKGHLTRQNTYLTRAKEWRCFVGTSSEVLQRLLSMDHG